MSGVRVVIMARRPRPGRTKTRLIVEGFLDAEGAAAVADAMCTCTLERLAPDHDAILAITPDGAADDAWPVLSSFVDPDIIDQGPGDLGARIDRVWRHAAGDRAVAFFGTDAPDVPAAALAEIPRGLARADVVIGPTADGGYWTLGARTHRPELLAGIDWGGDSVYDQTCRRAEGAGLSVSVLPEWHDVDRPADVFALRRRLAGATEPPLRRLFDRLTAVLGDLQDSRP